MGEPAKSSEATQDEINEIMGELEKLEKEIAAAPEAAETQEPHLKAVPDEPVAETESDVAAEAASSAAAALEEEQASQDEPVGEAPAPEPAADLGLPETHSHDEMADFRGASGDASMEDTLGANAEADIEMAAESAHEATDYSEENEDDAAEVAAAADMAAAAESSEKADFDEMTSSESSSGAGQATSEEGTLTMQLSGRMSLKLKYDFDGKSVTVGFVEDYLKVELEDGTEFKVPVNRTQFKRVA